MDVKKIRLQFEDEEKIVNIFHLIIKKLFDKTSRLYTLLFKKLFSANFKKDLQIKRRKGLLGFLS